MQSSEGAVAANPAATVKVARKEAQAKQEKYAHSIRYPFWFGGSASSMAACVTHPLDLGK